MKIEAHTRLIAAAPSIIDNELKNRIIEKAKKSSTLKKGLNLHQMNGAMERANQVLKRRLKSAGLKKLQIELQNNDISNSSEAALDHAVVQSLFF